MIHRNRRIIGQANPANHATGSPFKAPNGRPAGPYLTKVKPHAAAKLGHLGKIINGPVNPVQGIRYCVDKATGQLVVRLPGIGHGRGGHGHLELRQHVVKATYPVQARFRLLIHGQMQGNAQEHFLDAFHRLTAVRPDHIPLDEQIQAGIIDLLIPCRINKPIGPLNFFPAVLL